MHAARIVENHQQGVSKAETRTMTRVLNCDAEHEEHEALVKHFQVDTKKNTKPVKFYLLKRICTINMI